MMNSQTPEPDSNSRAAGESRTPRLPAEKWGSGITLALGGGFSRGFAHLGVLKVLEEERLPIAAIVGTSIGGLLGAAYADGVSVGDLCDLGRRVRLRDFLRFHQPEQDARAYRRDCIAQFVEKWFHAQRLEDLPILTAIVATDLDSGEPYIFTRGPVEIAIRAGCAFPGLVKPVKFDGRLLADGCIAAPIPTTIASRISGGYVLAVNVGANSAPASSAERRAQRSDPGWPAWPAREVSFEPSWSRDADLVLEPDVHAIDWNDFSRVDDAVAAGAEAMRRVLPKLVDSLAAQAKMDPPPCAPAAPEGDARV